MQKLLALTLGLLVLGGCTKPRDRVSRSWSAQKIKLHCSSGDCPAAVGLLVYPIPEGNGFRLYRCTATLISPNTILTNAHCDMTAKRGHNGRFILPSAGDVNQVVEVVGANYIAREGDEGLGRDLAILKLARPLDATFPKISREIPESLSTLNTFVVNESTAGPTGYNYQIDKKTCRTISRMAIFGGGASENHIGLGLFDCDIVRGNSGAAVFRPGHYDRIEAVINTRWDWQNDQGSPLTLDRLFLTVPNEFRRAYAMAERVHCVEIEGQPAPAKKCAMVSLNETYTQPLRLAISQEIERRQANLLVQNMMTTTEIFEAELPVKGKKRGGLVILLAEKPYCYMGKGQPLKFLSVDYFRAGLTSEGRGSLQLIDRLSVDFHLGNRPEGGATYTGAGFKEPTTVLQLDSHFGEYMDSVLPAEATLLKPCDEQSGAEVREITRANLDKLQTLPPRPSKTARGALAARIKRRF